VKIYIYGDTVSSRKPEGISPNEITELMVGRHSLDYPFPVFKGWTPAYLLQGAGFKLEFHFDLRKTSLAVSQPVVKQKLRELNKKGIDYLVFRSWRGFPPWDSFQGYSLGSFKGYCRIHFKGLEAFYLTEPEE
jgi:hypothetical protein